MDLHDAEQRLAWLAELLKRAREHGAIPPDDASVVVDSLSPWRIDDADALAELIPPALAILKGPLPFTTAMSVQTVRQWITSLCFADNEPGTAIDAAQARAALGTILILIEDLEIDRAPLAALEARTRVHVAVVERACKIVALPTFAAHLPALTRVLPFELGSWGRSVVLRAISAHVRHVDAIALVESLLVHAGAIEYLEKDCRWCLGRLQA
jgi:hypothetical protein